MVKTMNNKEWLQTIYHLREKIELNKLVVFVGAGVSCNVDGNFEYSGLMAHQKAE